jgi:hypothetical protein
MSADFQVSTPIPAPIYSYTEAEVRAWTAPHGAAILVGANVFFWVNAADPALDTGAGSSVLATEDGSGAYVRQGFPLPFRAVLEHGTGTATLWSMPIDTAIAATIEIAATAYGGVVAGVTTKRWIGTLGCLASREGAGALLLESPTAGAPWKLSDPLWNPVFDTAGNTVRFRLTADTNLDVRCKFTVSIKGESTADSLPQIIPPLDVARAAVLADNPTALYYCDVGVLPNGLAPDGDVTGWRDQSAAGAHHQTFYAGRYPKYRDVAGVKSLEFLSTAALYSTVVGAANATGDYTLRFTYTGIANGTCGLLFGRTGTIISIHAGTSWNNDGANIVATFGGAAHVLGAMQDGCHNYEIRVDKAGMTAQLFVDAVAASAPVAFDVISIPTEPLALGWASTVSVVAVGKLHGFGVQDSLGDATQMGHWNTMAHLAWGAP